ITSQGHHLSHRFPTAKYAGPPPNWPAYQLVRGYPAGFNRGGNFSGKIGRYARRRAETGLNPACRNQRTFSLVRVNVDKADMNPAEGLAALHPHGLADHALAIREMAAVPPGKGTGDLDILDCIVVAVAQREGDQRLRAKAAATPGLRSDLQAVEGRC